MKTLILTLDSTDIREQLLSMINELSVHYTMDDIDADFDIVPIYDRFVPNHAGFVATDRAVLWGTLRVAACAKYTDVFLLGGRLRDAARQWMTFDRWLDTDRFFGLSVRCIPHLYEQNRWYRTDLNRLAVSSMLAGSIINNTGEAA